MQRRSIWCLPIFLLAFAPHLGAQPPQAGDLSGEDRFVPFYEWWLDERPDESEVVLEAYRAALRELPNDPDRAAVAIQDLEARLNDDNDCVNTVQDRLFERLAAEEPEALVPVLHLQHQVFREHVRRGQLWLADDARHKLERWTDRYAQAAGTPEARLHASRTLLSFAYLMRRVQVEDMLEQSMDVLGHALELRPDDPLVLHLEGLHAELLERYALALERLERLHSLQPEDPVVRLRLARARAHTGDVDGARAELGALDEADAPAWIERLALQERARWLEATGRPGQTRRFLEQGIERFPDDFRLGVALAAHRRLAGDAPPGASAELLEAFARDPGPSPRLVYEAGPYEEIHQVQVELEIEALQARPRLTAALEQDFRNLWLEDDAKKLRRQARYSRCSRPFNPQLPEALR